MRAKLELGDEAKDPVSGFHGIIVAKTTYLNGCDRVVLQGKANKDGKIPDNHFDEPQLVVVKRKKIKPALPEVERKKTGGPNWGFSPKK